MKNVNDFTENAVSSNMRIAFRTFIPFFCILFFFLVRDVSAQSPLTFSMEVTNAVCNGGQGAVAFIDVSGGVPPYSYAVYRLRGTPCWVITGPCEVHGCQVLYGPTAYCDGCQCRFAPIDKPSVAVDADTLVCSVMDSMGIEKLDTVIVTEPPAITVSVTPSGNVKGCKGSQLTLAASANASVWQYDWLKDGLVIPGQHQITLMAIEDGSYAAKVTDLSGCTQTSADTKVTFKKLPKATITQQPCQNGAVKLQATEGANYTYKWKKGNKFIDGATLNTYLATVDAKYKVEVTNPTGCSKLSGPSEVIISCRQSSLADEHTLTSVSLYPNPNGGNFSIELTASDAGDQVATIIIVNMLGQSVHEEQITLIGGKIKKDFNLDLSLSDGIYQVQVLVNEKIYTEKVIIQRK